MVGIMPNKKLKKIWDYLKENGMSDTVRDCTKEGFAIGHYEAPG
jgi:hypothetical protein